VDTVYKVSLVPTDAENHTAYPVWVTINALHYDDQEYLHRSSSCAHEHTRN